MRKTFLILILIVFANCMIHAQGAADTIKYAGAITCITGSVVLAPNNPPSGATFQWQLNGTEIAGATSETYTATQTGEYRVLVNGSSFRQVNVSFKAVASFTSSVVSECVNGAVNFTNTTTPASNANGYEWNFGDPNSGANSTTSINASHTFVGNGSNASQNFTVRLIATSQSCKDTAYKSLTIKQSPNADLGPNPDNNVFKLCSSQGSGTLTFNNLSTTKATNTNYKIVWGDNTPDYVNASFIGTVSHAYNAGNYNLTFSVTGSNGCVTDNVYNIFIGSNPAVGIGNPGNTSICSGDSLTFPITGTATNTIGTRYIVSFNDASKADTFYHPNVPSSIAHIFKITSCGITSGGSSNSFQASISATNPCSASFGSVVPIYVSGRPKASFTNVRDTICVNSTTTFSNNSLTTSYINNGSCVPGKFVWSITPAAGWSIVSGTLGSENGIVDPVFWQSGSTAINIRFTTAGTYFVKVKTGNSSCGSDSIIKTICVNPLPVAGFTVNQITGCSPLTIQATNTSNQPTCGSNTYTWAVTYAATGSCLPATSSFTYLNGTNASSTDPQFRFDNPGTYTISLITKNSSGLCTSNTFTQQIIVKAKPTVTLTAATTVCQNGTITPSITVGNCNATTPATYLWTFAGGTPATATSLSPGSISYATAGTYTIQVDVTNECGTTTKTQQITVGAAPDVIVPANQTFCNGVATGILVFSSSVNGTTYSWTNNNTTIGLSASGNGNVPSFIAKNTTGVPVTATITVTPLNGCTGQSQSFTITINPGATIANAGINQKLCNATTTALTANAAVVGTGSWTKIAGNSGVIDNAALPTSTLSGLTAPDSIVLVWTIANAANTCKGTSDTVVILNRPAITVANAGNDTTVCGFPSFTSSTAIVLNGNIPKYFETGIWTVVTQPNNGNSSIPQPNNPKAVFSFFNIGTYVLKWTITNDAGCVSSATFTHKVFGKTVSGSIGATSSSSNNVCIGSNSTLTLTSYTGTILKWQYNTKPIADNIWLDTLVTTPTIQFTNVQDTFAVRAIVVSADTACASSDTTASVIVNVAPQPIGGITGPDATVCGTSNNGVVTLSGQVGNIIRWEKSIDNGISWSTITNTTTSLAYSNITQTTKFRAIVQNGVCVAVASTITTISVAGATGSSNAGADQFLCNQTGTQLNAAVAPSGSTGTWVQVAGPAVNITNATLYNTTITGLTPNTYKFVWAISNGVCAATNDTVVVINYPALTNTITGTTQTICGGQSITLVGQNATGGSGLYTYQWQQSTDSITWVNIAGATLANINFSPLNTVFVRRLVTSNTCNLASNAATIIVQPSIGNNAILKDTTICIGNPLAILTGSLPTGGNTIYTYQWENSTDGGITWLPITLATAKDYLPVGLTVTTKFRRVVSSNVCTGLQANSSNVVTITINPNAKAQYNYTKNIDCAVFNITNAITNVTNTGNGSYIWYANNVQIGNSATVPNYSIINPQDSIVVKLKAISLYGCKNDSLEHKFYTITKPAPSFTLSDTVGCGPLAITITNTTVNAHLFNFKWDFGNGTSSSLTNPSTVILQSNPTRFDTIYTITLSTFTACDTVVTVQKIRVKAKPQALFAPNKTIGCSPLPVTFNNTSRGNNTNFVWDFGDGSATVVTSNTNAVQHTFSTGKQDTFKVKLIASNTCGNDTLVYNIVVSPNKIKLDFAVNGSDAVSCLPSTVRFINNTSGATSFNWNFGDGNVLSTTKNLDTVSYTFLQAGNYIVTLFATNGCSDTTTSELLQVFNAPSANFNAIPTTVCLGDTIRFTNQSDTITSLLWNFKDGYTTTVINPTHAYKVAGIYNVQLTAIRQYNSGLACTDTISKPITVLSTLPGAMKVSDSISSCVPFTTTFTNLSLPSAITIWQYGNGVADTGNVVTYTYTKVGNYTVNMLATNSGGCKFAATANIQVNGPEGIWLHDKGFICGATPVRYEVFATGTDSVRWDFGDGISITTSGKIIYHTYTKSGLYLPTATLISSNLKTCTVTLKAIDTVKVDYVSASFRIADNKICGNTTVTFTDTSRSYFPIASYSWTFGNGNTATTPIATQQYTTTNTWQTDLTITSTSGCSSSINKNSFIKVNNYPKVTIQTLPIACINKPTNYFASVTSNDSINLYSWQFSNGVNLNGQSVNNLYNTVGTYTAKVLVSTIYGCADSTTFTHTLNPTPTVVASVDQLICRGKSVPLSASGATTYSWVPLNSNLSCYTCNNPIAAPTTTTNYIVTGYNSVGCSDDDTVLITVAQPIKLTVSPNDTICISQSSRLSVSGGTSYVWSPSIGLSNTISATPLATPTLTTKYQVIGFDNHNCFQDTAYVEVAVGQYPTIQLAADQVLATGTLLPLNYTSTNGPLTSWKWTPATNLNCSDCAVPIATIKKDVCYTVVASNIYHCPATDTICIKVFCENTQVFIPNVFTPDNDGVNDVLMVRGTGIKTVKSFRIYNRWGQIVFERGNITPNNASQGWDGKINGTPASPDVYVYTCEVVCENDVTFTYKGNVAIIK